MAGGWGELGKVLGGGVDRQDAYIQGRYRSAQTEDALARAKVSQAEAIAKDKQNQLIDQIAGAQDPLSHELFGALIASGHGSDYSAIQSGMNNEQTRGFKTELSTPGVDPARQQELRAAIGDAPFNPLNAVGSKGAYTDARKPDAGVQLSDEMVPDEPSTHVKDYNFAVDQLHAPPGPDTFSRILRSDQQLNGGGVPYTKPALSGGPATAAVDPATVAGNASAITGAKTTAAAQSKLANSLPGTLETLDNMRKTIGEFVNLPGFSKIYGVQGAIDPRNIVPGTDGAMAKAARDNINAQTFSVAIQKMRGLGQLSNAEGSKVQQAFTKAMDPRLDAESADIAWAEVLRRLDRLQKVAETEAGTAHTAPGGTTSTSGEQPKSFSTEAEAEAAGLTPGTRVVIGGVSGTWQ